MIPEDQKGTDKPNTDARMHGHTEAQTPNQNDGYVELKASRFDKKDVSNKCYM